MNVVNRVELRLDSYTNSKRRKSSPQNINNCVKEISSRPMTAWRHAKRLAALEENDRRAAAKLARSKVNSMETAAQCRGYRTRSDVTRKMNLGLFEVSSSFLSSACAGRK